VSDTEATRDAIKRCYAAIAARDEEELRAVVAAAELVGTR
jgi:hypothetical protein